MSPGVVEVRLVHAAPVQTETVHALVNVAVPDGDMGAPAVMGMVGAGMAGLRVMRPCFRRPDLKSRRDDAGERPGEGGGLDRTTMRRVMMFQYPFLSRFVALQANRPATPMNEGVKGATF
jgi:hypothetical protein